MHSDAMWNGGVVHVKCVVVQDAKCGCGIPMWNGLTPY